MNLFKRLFGRGDDDGEDLPIALDVETRKTQLHRLEKALDALANGMREHSDLTSNPGWQGRMSEYGRLAGEAMMLRQRGPTREELLDLCFEIRPVFGREPQAGLDDLVPLQAEVMDAAEQLQVVLPGER